MKKKLGLASSLNLPIQAPERSRRALILPFLLLYSLSASCQKEPSVPEQSRRELSIGVMAYDSTSNLPHPTSNYLLRIEMMRNPNTHDDLFYKWLYYDTVKTVQPVVFTASSPKPKSILYTTLAPARYIVTVQKGDKVSVSEIIYKGGDIQLNLILK